MIQQENISLKFFEHFYQIKDKKDKELANIYTLYADKSKPVFGTVYLMHGYGGSPMEFCMKLPAQKALENGFDVVAIEGVALSATYTSNNNIIEMTLPRHETAIYKSLEYCKNNDKLCHDYKVAWAHSLSGRALADLIVENDFVRKYFNEYVMNNPYFLPPSKLTNLKKSMMERDSSGKFWNSVLHKLQTVKRIIDGVEYKIPASTYNFSVPLPQNLKHLINDIDGLVNTVAELVHDKPIQFILGKDDTQAEYAQNKSLFKALPTEHKSIHKIPGANHFFDSAPSGYIQCTEMVMSGIRNKLLNTK